MIIFKNYKKVQILKNKKTDCKIIYKMLIQNTQ